MGGGSSNIPPDQFEVVRSRRANMSFVFENTIPFRLQDFVSPDLWLFRYIYLLI